MENSLILIIVILPLIGALLNGLVAAINGYRKKEIWGEKTAGIMERLKRESELYFQDLFTDHRTLSEFIVTFLALLELVHTGLVRIYQPEAHKEIRIEAKFKEQEDNDHESITQANH